MKVLLVTDSYWPEIRSASKLMVDLAGELKSRGHEVIVITTWPKYNLDANLSLDGIKADSVAGEIRVIRVKALPLHNSGYLIRGVAQLLLPIILIYKLITLKIRVEAAIVYSPPLPLAFVGLWCKKFGAKFILNLQDLFPQNAVDLGIMRNKWLVKLFFLIEKYCYSYADSITVHSNGNADVIRRRFPGFKNKIKTIHNWIEIANGCASCSDIDYRLKFGITKKYVAVFAGVIGPSQGLEIILGIAEALKYRDDLLFLIVGDGTEKQKLIDLKNSKNLHNVQFENFVSSENYSDLLKICSIGLVCLSSKNKMPVVPGKILGYMAAGMPIASFLHDESDGHQIVADAKCGITASSSNAGDCISKFELLMSRADDFELIGKNGFEYASKNFDKRVCIDKIEALF